MKSLKNLACLYTATCILNAGPALAQGSWSAVGGGLNAQGLAMAEYNGNLYIGKLNFTVPDEINKWDGTSLSGVGSGTDGPVGAFAVYDSTLYVGGGFSTAGGNAVNDIAKWSGSSWAAVGNQMDNFCINAMVVYNNELYAAGYGFTPSSTPSAFTVARWTGTNWVNVGAGISGGDVYCLAVYNTELYASGTFTSADGVSAAHIAKWNGTSWSAVGSGVTNGTTVYTLKEYNGTLYAGGDFSTIGGVATNCIAKWDGSAWTKVGATGNGTNNTVIALCVYNGSLYAGGAFSSADGITANHIAKWDGINWTAMGHGVGTLSNTSEQVWCIAPYKSSIYAAGVFATASGITATNIAKWSDPTEVNDISGNSKNIHIYPNPTEENSVIEFDAGDKTDVTIDICDIAGRKLLNVFQGQVKAGKQFYSIGGLAELSRGVYVVKIVSGNNVLTDRLIVK